MESVYLITPSSSAPLILCVTPLCSAGGSSNGHDDQLKVVGYDFTRAADTAGAAGACSSSTDCGDAKDEAMADMPYIVRALPSSVDRLKLTYPSLSERMELLIVRDYVAMDLDIKPPPGIPNDCWVQEVERPFFDTAVRMIVL
jgi:hypothetical protein